MNDATLVSVLIMEVCGFALGWWLGRHQEKIHQCEMRLDWSASDECKKLTVEEANGMLAMWKWLQNKK